MAILSSNYTTEHPFRLRVTSRNDAVDMMCVGNDKTRRMSSGCGSCMLNGEMLVLEAGMAGIKMSGDSELPLFPVDKIVECIIQIRCFLTDFFGHP